MGAWSRFKGLFKKKKSKSKLVQSEPGKITVKIAIPKYYSNEGRLMIG